MLPLLLWQNAVVQLKCIYFSAYMNKSHTHTHTDMQLQVQVHHIYIYRLIAMHLLNWSYIYIYTTLSVWTSACARRYILRSNPRNWSTISSVTLPSKHTYTYIWIYTHIYTFTPSPINQSTHRPSFAKKKNLNDPAVCEAFSYMCAVGKWLPLFCRRFTTCEKALTSKDFKFKLSNMWIAWLKTK